MLVMLVTSSVDACPNCNPAAFVTHHDEIPNFGVNYTISTAGSGNWSNPATWKEGRVPRANDIVKIYPDHVINYDVTSDASLAALGVAGTLRFRSNGDTRIKVANFIVGPSGKVEIGSESNPLPAQYTAEIIIADRQLYSSSPDPITGVMDPRQYGTSLISLGDLFIYGAPRRPTWMRLASEARAGERSVQLLDAVSGWRPGDRIVIPDTRHLNYGDSDDVPQENSFYQTETLTLQSVSDNGKVLTFNEALEFDHAGAKNPDGSAVYSFSGERLLPHVGNLTRNVIVRSENPTGTRGHTIFTGRGDVDIRYAGWYDLGRTTLDALDSSVLDPDGDVVHVGTNQIARYWVHFHHYMGPRPGDKGRETMPSGLSAREIRTWLEADRWQYKFIGNAIAASSDQDHEFKWGIDIHGSHFGLIADNVIYNIPGSGIQTENATESYNLFTRNFTVRTPGLGHLKLPKPNDSDSAGDVGKDGTGLWFRGPHNWVENNVAADSGFAGLYYNGYYLDDVSLPLFPGASDDPAERNRRGKVPMLSCANNEVYGPSVMGIYGAWVAGCCDPTNWPEMLVKNLVVWNAFKNGVHWYHNGRTTFDGLLLRGDPDVTRTANSEDGEELTTTGMHLTNYENLELTIKNADIRGYVFGIDMPRKMQDEDETEPPTRITDAVLENYVNMRYPIPRNNAARKHTVLTDVHFRNFTRPGVSGYPAGLDIEMNFFADHKSADASVPDVLEIRNFNGVADDDFFVYHFSNGASFERPRIDGYVSSEFTGPTPETSRPLPPTNLRIISGPGSQ